MKTNYFFAVIVSSLSIMTAQSQFKTVPYTDGNQKLEGLAANPKKANPKKAGVLILPAWMGIDAHSKESAQELSKLGYYVFVADIYGVGNRPVNTQEAGQKAGYFKNNYKEYQKRIQLALDQLIKSGANPNEIAVIGYCFGGSGALEAARGNFNVKGVVSFHGGLGRDAARSIEPIKPKVLVLHGADDFYVPETEIKAFQEEMRTSKADWQMVYYADAVHAFTHKDAGNDKSKGVAYNEKADKRSWRAMKDFFNELFK
ncbi:putative dienelactone hydrolase [Flavobacterium saliperosum S13]|uniref:Dienelactone hydrolase n=2 Tax=Flavobacterium saliperosum TaxID=329186 RepID=A0A1G4V1P5_9FLAO|nr:dienelactone hydrolase family protein [Flavobacterium saliperosum]ESU28579.1 putative dienelactone hydrolase [Flavobacterium saliperosum S13]SCW99845.1 Dienelactone hydrolase [Flavobacterium saliperosum]